MANRVMPLHELGTAREVMKQGFEWAFTYKEKSEEAWRNKLCRLQYDEIAKIKSRRRDKEGKPDEKEKKTDPTDSPQVAGAGEVDFKIEGKEKEVSAKEIKRNRKRPKEDGRE